MKDAKYSLDIMKEELKSKYISLEIKYAFEASIEALELQIPKTVNRITEELYIDALPCPNCKKDLMEEVQKSEYDPEYCSKCGQKLLWEE